jgi:hypothetical protein
LALRVELIAPLIGGPGEGVKGDSGHRLFPVSALFPITLAFLPTPKSIAKKKPTGKKFRKTLTGLQRSS